MQALFLVTKQGSGSLSLPAIAGDSRRRPLAGRLQSRCPHSHRHPSDQRAAMGDIDYAGPMKDALGLARDPTSHGAYKMYTKSVGRPA